MEKEQTAPSTVKRQIKILCTPNCKTRAKNIYIRPHHQPGSSVQIFDKGRTVSTLKPSLTPRRTRCDCLWRDCGDCNPRPSPVGQPHSHPSQTLLSLPPSFPLWSVTQIARSSWFVGSAGPCPAAACGRRRGRFLESKGETES